MLARNLSQRSHQVSVCTTAFPGLPKYTVEMGLRIYRLHGFFSRMPLLYQVRAGRFPPPVKDRLLVRQLRKILDEQDPDIVHAQGWIVYSLLPALSGSKVPLVLNLLDYREICPAAGMLPEAASCGMSLGLHCVACGRELYGSGPLGTVKSLATYIAIRGNKGKLKRVDKFIAMSSYVKKVHVEHLGLEGSRFVVIPHFHVPETDTRLESSGRLPDDFILFVGALMPAKGAQVLIDAYRRLNTATKLVVIGIRYPNYSCGDGEGVVLLENPPRDLILEAYRNCRFVVVPSLWPEPFGIVVLEAMSQRKAVIASNIGGLKEPVVDGETGILVPASDSDKLAEAISCLLEKPEVASRMGEAGYRRFTENYTPDVVVPRTVDVYDSLIGRRGA